MADFWNVNKDSKKSTTHQEAIHTYSEKAGRLYFGQRKETTQEPTQEQYAVWLKSYFTGWLNGMLSETKIAERLYSTPGISQLLFALLCKKMWGQKKRPSQRDAERLLEICCDLGVCVLQVAENIVGHTEGGVLSVRINDNWKKIEDVFQAKGPKSANWYMRISLVDFSRSSILDNIKKKSGIDGLTLSHIFMDPETSGGVPQEDYQQAAESYERYLNDSEQIIHHYGLAVFRNVVNQYGGCFTVKSSARSTVVAGEWYAPTSESIVYSGVGDGAPHIPGSEYDILLPLDSKLLEDRGQPSNPSILLKPKYIVPSISRKVVFEEDISGYPRMVCTSSDWFAVRILFFFSGHRRRTNEFSGTILLFLYGYQESGGQLHFNYFNQPSSQFDHDPCNMDSPGF